MWGRNWKERVATVLVIAVILTAWVGGMKLLAAANGPQHSTNVCTPEYVEAHPSQCPEDPIGGSGLP